MTQKPTLGRIVHFVLPSTSPRAGEHRAAIVTGAWGGLVANLAVFLDQPEDVSKTTSNLAPEVGVVAKAWSADYSDEFRPGTWHWPERELAES